MGNTALPPTSPYTTHPPASSYTTHPPTVPTPDPPELQKDHTGRQDAPLSPSSQDPLTPAPRHATLPEHSAFKPAQENTHTAPQTHVKPQQTMLNFPAPPSDGGNRRHASTNLRANACVEAGPGTGKTTVLVERVRQLIGSGHTTLDRIAVMTFTEKAAAELSERLAHTFQEAAQEAARQEAAAGNSEAGKKAGKKHARYTMATQHLPEASIGTIHSFAATILRDHAVSAGLDSAFRITDPAAIELEFARETQDWLHSLLDTPPQELLIALSRGISLADLRNLAKILFAHLDLLPTTPFLTRPKPDMNAVMHDIRVDIQALVRLRAKCVAPDADQGVHQIDMLSRFLDATKGLENQELEHHLLFQGPEKIRRVGAMPNWHPAHACREQKTICARLEKNLNGFRNDLRTDALCGVFPIIEGFVCESATRRAREGNITFDDLLVRTRDLLRSHPKIRVELSHRFRHILIDEFQDTDPLQAEIIAALVTPEQEMGNQQRLRTEKPLSPTETQTQDNGKLFIVGDPKQSIYRFRRADMHVYDRFKRTFFSEDEIHPLRLNFRSTPDLVKWINTTFAPHFNEVPGIQPAYTPLLSARPDPQCGHPIVAIYEETPSARVDDVRIHEAALLADLIKEAVETESWLIRCPKEKRRPAKYGDIAVLTRSRTGLIFYEEAFEARDIPFSHIGTGDNKKRQEIRDLLACLRAIDKPDDGIAAVAALRSLAFGCSDRDLLHANLEEPGLCLMSRPTHNTPPRVRYALSVLQTLWSERKLPLTRLLTRVLDETHLLETALTLPNGEQIAANLMHVVDEAHTFTDAGGKRLRTFLTWMTAKQNEPNLPGDTTQNAVQFCSMHGAKGLEFPIVAIIDLYRQRARRPVLSVDREKQQLHLRLGAEKTGTCTPHFHKAQAQETLHVEAELRRLLYVACTRARDRLVFPLAIPSHFDGNNDLLGLLLPSLLNRDKTGRLSPAPGILAFTPITNTDKNISGAAEFPPQADIPDSSVAGHENREKKTVRETSSLFDRTIASWHTGRSTLVKEAAIPKTKRILGSFDDWDTPADIPDNRGPQPLWGPTGHDKKHGLSRALHHALAALDLTTSHSDHDIVQHATVFARHFDVEDAKQKISNMLKNVLGSKVIQRVKTGSNTATAVPFTVPTADGGVVEGRIDIVFTERNRLILVDVRTVDEQATDNQAMDEQARSLPPEKIRETIDALHSEIAIYTYAIEQATATPVEECVLLFADSGEEHILAGTSLVEEGRSHLTSLSLPSTSPNTTR